MKKITVIGISIFIIIFSSCNDSKKKRNIARKNLGKIAQIQSLFEKWDNIYQSEKIITTAYFGDSMQEERNNIRNGVKSYHKEFGFPKLSEVGRNYLNIFYLVSTENSIDGTFLKSYLQNINIEFDANNIDKYNFANCIDRITYMVEGKQTYGTLIKYIEGNGIELLSELKNKNEVNKFRNEIELNSIELFLQESELARLKRNRNLNVITYNNSL